LLAPRATTTRMRIDLVRCARVHILESYRVTPATLEHPPYGKGHARRGAHRDGSPTGDGNVCGGEASGTNARRGRCTQPHGRCAPHISNRCVCIDDPSPISCLTHRTTPARLCGVVVCGRRYQARDGGEVEPTIWKRHWPRRGPWGLVTTRKCVAKRGRAAERNICRIC
jgi:hypothetical protein